MSCYVQEGGDKLLYLKSLGKVHIPELSRSSLKHSQTLTFMPPLTFDLELSHLNVLQSRHSTLVVKMINLSNSQETLVDFIITLYINASHKTSPGSNDRKDLVKKNIIHSSN